ncbi:hypothetical protein BCV69DRAFT_311344 [Microstroma glucosiphilum]|uniref:Protein EFR3 n=1 Tax=Pseudomicrostroma glucosiphilum TaxID=1684307 RepID=A0A316UBH8_9BASI|nr:hypothetical protein BCV69DRAFT_311344 [Pseudomicrostroma glucosiphilum]PWN22546.1 hypothetical protein BCV69DRAFT_311344 [Pseudomicrostroma glucosiphilum]
MMCIPTPNHRKLVQDCYPPSKRIAGVENPSSNELGKLVYYAQSKPAKLSKVGKVLEERAAADARGVEGAGAANEKAKCGLLITIAILKALISECPRDITYISKSAQAIMAHAVKASAKSGNGGQRDLALSARASSTFFAYTSALDPARNSVEGELGASYLELLESFGYMATDRNTSDPEDLNRARLIGLGALSSAASSDVLYTSAFSRQASVIVPALLENMQAKSAPLDDLKAEAGKVASGSPTYTAFSSLAKKRPSHRKAPSLSGHVAGEKGPETAEVISASMGILHGLFKHADALQVQEAMKAVLGWMGGRGGTQQQWSNEEWARFLGTTLVRWTSLQYRFVILNSLLEHLVEDCEGPTSFKHGTLLEMIAAILKSKDLTLIGLSTSDALNNLAGLTVRRVHFDIKDPLLPQLVRCIESLAVHVYYADQLNDAAEELVARIVALNQPETDTAAAEATMRVSHLPRKSAATRRAGEAQKMESIRIVLFALMRIIIVANSNDAIVGKVRKRSRTNSDYAVREKGKASDPNSGITLAGARARIQPDALQPVTWLLASYDCGVRLAAAHLFIAYLKLEAQEPSAASSEAASLLHGISAAAYICTLSRSLRLPSTGSAGALENPLGQLVLVQRANESGSMTELRDESEAGVPLDYAALVLLFTLATDRLAGAALLAFVPALLAIDRGAARDLVAEGSPASLVTQRRHTTRLFLAKVWVAISEKWAVPSVRKEASTVLAALSDEILPTVPEPTRSLTLPEEVDLFPDFAEDASAGEGSAAASPVFDPSRIMKALASSAEVQTNTGMPEEALMRWFGRDWSVAMAIDDSAVGASPYHDPALENAMGNGHADKATRLTFETAAGNGSADMAANGSGQHPIGVDDFRQALGSKSVHGGGGAAGGAGRSVRTNRQPLQDSSLSKAGAAGGLQGLDIPIPGLRASTSGQRMSLSASRDSPFKNRTSAAPDAASLDGSVNSGVANGSGPTPLSAAERRASRRASRQQAPGGAGGAEYNGGASPVGGLVNGNGVGSGSAFANGYAHGMGQGGVSRAEGTSSVAGLLDSLGIDEGTGEGAFTGAGGAAGNGAGAGAGAGAKTHALVPPHAA